MRDVDCTAGFENFASTNRRRMRHVEYAGRLHMNPTGVESEGGRLEEHHCLNWNQISNAAPEHWQETHSAMGLLDKTKNHNNIIGVRG